MRKNTLLLICVLVLCGIITFSFAQSKPVIVKGKVVSIDTKGKTFTIQQPNGENITLGATLKQLNKVKVGETFVVTTRVTKKGVLEAWVVRPPAPLSK